MSLILAIEPDSGQADAVRRAVRTLPGVDLVLVDSRDAALAVLKGRVPELILLSALLLLFVPNTSSALDEVLVYKTKTTIKKIMSTGTQTRALAGYLVCYRNQDGWHVASLDRFTVLTNKFMELNFFDDAYVGVVSNSLVKLNLFPSPDYLVIDSRGKTNALNGDCSYSLSGKPLSLTNRVTHQSVLMPKTLSGATTADLFDFNAFTLLIIDPECHDSADCRVREARVCPVRRARTTCYQSISFPHLSKLAKLLGSGDYRWLNLSVGTRPPLTKADQSTNANPAARGQSGRLGGSNYSSIWVPVDHALM